MIRDDFLIRNEAIRFRIALTSGDQITGEMSASAFS